MVRSTNKEKQYVELIKHNSQQGSYCEACDPSWPNYLQQPKFVINSLRIVSNSGFVFINDVNLFCICGYPFRRS
jgi:hypothetical protein